MDKGHKKEWNTENLINQIPTVQITLICTDTKIRKNLCNPCYLAVELPPCAIGGKGRK